MILGFAGFAGGGKDTAGRYLEHAYGFRRAHYAAELKRIVGELYDFSDAQLHGDAKGRPDPRYPMPDVCPSCGTAIRARLCEPCGMEYPTHMTPRLALQVIGVAGRRLYSGVWVEATMRAIGRGERVAVCDVRFPNEVAAIQAREGRVVRLTRGAPESAHPSEMALADRPDLFDRVIRNEGPIEDLHAALDGLLAELGIARAA